MNEKGKDRGAGTPSRFVADDKLSLLFVGPSEAIRNVMRCIDQNACGIALVVDDERKLVSTITDGDVRRAILDGVGLDASVTRLLDRKAQSPYPEPITAKVGTTRADLADLMREHTIRQVPLLDDDGRVVDLALEDDLLSQDELPVQAVIMAGGFGTRLRPLTDDVPKPMLPVGDQPVLERILRQLRASQIRSANITTHYLPDMIKDHFGDGHDLGLSLKYVTEDMPLGTAGALGLMEAPTETLLVINGDVLTSLDFRSMLLYHREHRADMTVAVRQYDLNVPYGVLEGDGAFVHRIREKPTYNFFVNAGIYLLEPDVHSYIQKDEQLDMTDLIEMLLDEGRSVVSFPVVEYWLDIGQHDHYEQAQDDVNNGRCD